ncbi:3'-5' exoribonuclease [Microaerobacter geothermalis]|nr:3'-5' exoribonuclease [Microaerobacter geothermalis]
MMQFFNRMFNINQGVQGGSLQQEAWKRSILKEASERSLLSQPLEKVNYVVVDTETTGFRPDLGNEIISLGAVHVEDGLGQRSFSSLVKPTQPIPSHITDLTGISMKDVKKAPTLKEILPSFIQFVGSRVIVGYHLGHDLTFLNYYLWRTKFSRITNRTIELRRVISSLYPELIDLIELDDILNHFQIPISKRHTALGDARMTAALWSILLNQCKKQGIITFQDLYEQLALS